MLRNYVIGMLVILIAVGIFFVLAGKESKAGEKAFSSTTSDEDKVAALEAEISQMKKDMKQVSLQSKMAAQLGGRMIPVQVEQDLQQAEEENRAESMEDLEAEMENSRQKMAERFEHLSMAMADERRDNDWAASGEAEINSVVRQIQESGMIGASVISSECKSTMCKVEVGYDNPMAQTEISDRIRSQHFSGGEVRRYEENGQLRSTAYYYRQGYEAPK